METNLKPFGSFIAFAVAIVALAAAFSFPAPAQAQAQDETYVDLSIEIAVGLSFVFTARNQGTATAYGVTVDIEIADQTIHSTGSGQFTQKSGTTCSGNIPGTTCISGAWTVGVLGAGEETSFTIGPRLASGLPCCSGGSDRWPVPARAVIKNTVPQEEERSKGDNTAVGWILVNQGGTNTLEARTDYWLEASVDDLLPDAGDTVKFTFKAVTSGGAQGSVGGAKVRLKLDDGMGAPTATPSTETFGAASGLTRTWDWDFDLTHPTASKTLEVSTTLDNPLPAGVSRSDLCLTAELSAERPDDRVLGDTSAKICLREDPTVPFEGGELNLFTLYPCVGVSPIAYPCRDNDDDSTADNGLELVAGSDTRTQFAPRAHGISRRDDGSTLYLRPESVLIRVDPEARVGTKWYTGSDENSDSNDAGLISGALLHLDFLGAGWTPYTFAIVDVNPKKRPGSMAILRMDNTGFTLLDADTKTSLGPINSALDVLPLVVVFGTLGTHQVDLTYNGWH